MGSGTGLPARDISLYPGKSLPEMHPAQPPNPYKITI